MAERIRVMIADDHTILRAGVRALLEARPDIDVVGEAKDGDEAIALAETLEPDVVLMDIAMPGTNGLEATRILHARFPEMRVLVLTMHRSDEYFFEMLKAGAYGYVLKGADTSELVDAIRAVSSGQVFMHPSLTQRLLQDYLKRVNEPDRAVSPALTKRETEILRLLAEGLTNKEIADRLFVSLSTIHSHRTNLMKKLNLGDRRKLVEYARRCSLIVNP